MTSAELGGELGISAAGVSGAVTYLTQMHMIGRERVPGTRRDVYVVDEHAWHETLISNNVVYAPMVGALERAIAELGDTSPERRRLDLTREFLVFMTGEMTGLARRWERRKRALLRE